MTPVAMQLPESFLHFYTNPLYGQKLTIVSLGMRESENWLLYLPFV